MNRNFSFLSLTDTSLITGNAAFAFVATDLTSTLLQPGVMSALILLVSTLITVGFNLYKGKRAPQSNELEQVLRLTNTLVEQLNYAQRHTGSLSTQVQIAAAKDTAVTLEQQLVAKQ